MGLSFESFISRRYLSSKRKPFFASFLLFITLLAVTAGVFALIFVLAVMSGFEGDFERRVLGFKAPITIYGHAGEDLSVDSRLIQDLEDLKKAGHSILRVAPFAEGEAVIRSESGATLGARVRGISEPPSPARFDKLNETDEFSERSLLMGEELAATLRVHPDFSEDIRLIFPLGDVGPTGEMIPRARQLTLTGIFRSGFYDYDSKYVLIPYREALRLFGSEARTGLEVWTRSPEVVDEVKRVLEEKLAALSTDFNVRTWKDENPKLFQAMKLEKIGMFLLLSALLLVASFNIFGLTSLMVLDKTRDMAILRAAGLKAWGVRRIFLLKAAAIGLIGAGVGGGLGLLVTLLLQRYPVPLPTTYYLHTLPLRLNPWEVAWVLLMIPVLTTLSALYPAWQAARTSPVEVLRYE